MKILALDLGTNSGYCLVDGDKPWIYGTHSFQLGRYEGGGVRFLRFRRTLFELTEGVDMVAYEEVGFVKHAQAAEILHGFRTEVMTLCEGRKIPYVGVPVSTLKKFATGKGNAGKPMMARALAERRDEFPPLADMDPKAIEDLGGDTIDALWVARYALDELAPVQV